VGGFGRVQVQNYHPSEIIESKNKAQYAHKMRSSFTVLGLQFKRVIRRFDSIRNKKIQK
jgi:hypothetical protein